jgi:hypothetical protein
VYHGCVVCWKSLLADVTIGLLALFRLRLLADVTIGLLALLRLKLDLSLVRSHFSFMWGR